MMILQERYHLKLMYHSLLSRMLMEQLQDQQFDITITGFAGATTDVVGGDLGITKVAHQATNNEIAQAIIDKGFVTGANPALSATDITITNRIDNNITGTVTCTVNINNSMGYDNGDLRSTIPFNDIEFTGFSPALETKFVSPYTVTVPDALASLRANDPSITPDVLRQAVFEKKDSFFSNLAPGTDANDIVISNPTADLEKGTIY